MKFIEVVTPPPDIYHDFSIWKTLREYKFIPVNIKNCGRRNVRKHREMKIGDQYIILNISSKLDCMDKREVTSLKIKDYMVISGKGLTTSLALSTKSPNKKKVKVFHN